MSVEEIMARMLNDISDDYDKTVGSFFYDAIAPAAIELQKAYEGQDGILKNAFASTASGEFLERKCSELGVNRKLAVPSSGKVVITGAIGATVRAGACVATEIIEFVVMETVAIGELGVATVNVKCTQKGSVGNVAANMIRYFPITIEGVNGVNNPDAFTNGYNEETDQSLYGRYYEKVTAPATSGNSAHYEQWSKNVTGVGDAKIFPTWNGAGSVKVVICDSNKKAADAKLIKNTAEYIETQRPIGATVTVISAACKSINVAASIIPAPEYILQDIQEAFTDDLKKYFAELAFKATYVSYARIGTLLFSTDGILDYSNLTLNDSNTNVLLSEEEIPIVGTIKLEVL